MTAASEADFNRLNLSAKDFGEAHEYLEAFDTGLSDVMRRSLLTSATITYARPFTRHHGDKRKAALTASIAVTEVLSDEQQKLHVHIMRLRHQAVAHSAYDRKPTRRIRSAGRSAMSWSKPFDILWEPINVAAFRDMARALQNACITKMMAISEELGGPDTRTGMTVVSGELSLRIPLNAFLPQELVPLPQHCRAEPDGFAFIVEIDGKPRNAVITHDAVEALFRNLEPVRAIEGCSLLTLRVADLIRDGNLEPIYLTAAMFKL